MTQSVLVALAIVSLAPAPAQGSRVIVPAKGHAAATGDFSVSQLIGDIDHVLASVDIRTPLIADPFCGDARAFATEHTALELVGAKGRGVDAYGPADAAREPLPEPATWLMMILGFFGLSFAVRRRSIATGDRVRFS